MLSKSISDRSAPHHGMGRASKCLSAFSRNLRIQSGSDFIEEISSTTSVESPLFGLKTECEGSLQPKRYPLLSSWRCSSWVIAMPTSLETRCPIAPAGGMGPWATRSMASLHGWPAQSRSADSDSTSQVSAHEWPWKPRDPTSGVDYFSTGTPTSDPYSVQDPS